jgi:hypothetical protein
LEKGDILITLEGEIILEEFDYIEKITDVYNFEVSGTRDYYAN